MAASLGRFFDQRFIDYLDSNFDDVDTINWRRFEALACPEFLDRDAWRIKLGTRRRRLDIRA